MVFHFRSDIKTANDQEVGECCLKQLFQSQTKINVMNRQGKLECREKMTVLKKQNMMPGLNPIIKYFAWQNDRNVNSFYESISWISGLMYWIFSLLRSWILSV